jgi:hypothetical protein
MEKAEQDCEYSTVRTGHLEQDSQNKMAGTGQPENERLNWTAQMGQAKWDRKMMACRSEMLQTARAGLPAHDCQYGTARRACQDRTQEQNCQDRGGQDFEYMTSGTEQPEQILL